MDDAGSPELEVLRREIAELHVRRTRGDLSQRVFQKTADAKTLDLFRAVARTRMDAGEVVEQEHHVIVALTRLNQKVLRDSSQELVSLFASSRRIVEVRTVSDKDVPVTCDEGDRLSLTDLTYREVRAVLRQRRYRGGQLAAGTIIAAVGVLGGFQLGFTGPALVALGAVGALHALLFPTRWVEISGGRPDGQSAVVRVQCLRKRSAKRILKLVRDRCSPHAATSGRRDEGLALHS